MSRAGPGGGDARDPLLDELAGVLREPSPPPGFADRLHEGIDAGFLDPPARRGARRRWPIAVAAAAALLLVALTVVAVARRGDDRFQARTAGDAPLAITLHVQAVSADGGESRWLADGDAVAVGSWLQLRAEAPPGTHLALARVGPADDVELIYRWPRAGPFRAREARDGDVWYAVELPPGEISFVALVSRDRLGPAALDEALHGVGAGDAGEGRAAATRRAAVRVQVVP